jgi:quercetin dioxygenase-like cupin family protein
MITRRQVMKALAFGSAVLGPELISQIGLAATGENHATPGATVSAENGVTVRQLLMQPLPAMSNKMGAVVTVEYAPGAASPPHRHPGPVFGYVLEGSVEVQVDPGMPITYTQGQIWYEPLRHTHRVSRNASKSQPAKLLAFLIIEKGQSLTEPATTRI